MLLQEEIVFEEYYRCYCIGGKYVRIMSYEPRNPHHLRYVADFKPSEERLQLMTDIVLAINKYLGYDFNTVELAIRDGVPYAIDFATPLPMPISPAWAKPILNGWWKRPPISPSKKRSTAMAATTSPGVSMCAAVPINCNWYRCALPVKQDYEH